MLTTRSTHRITIVAALVCALLAIAAPIAAARPADIQAQNGQATAKPQQAQDLRSADARDAAVNSTATTPLPGPPTRPVDPQPINPAPVVQASDTGGGLDSTTVALGFGGGLLVLGAVAGVVLHSRRVSRGHIAA